MDGHTQETGITESNTATQTSLEEIYRPILRGYFLVFALYYLTMIGLNWLSMAPGRDFLTLQTTTGFAAVFALFAAQIVREPRPSGAIEVLLFGMNLLVVCNVWVALTIDFLPEKLTYFIIMSMLFALASTSFRQSLASIVMALLAMFLFVDRLDAATLSAFALVTFGTDFTGVAIA